MEANRMGTEWIQRVRERAYQLWEAAGCEHGRDLEHWLRAESQISAEQAAIPVDIKDPHTTSAPPSQTHHATTAPSGKAAAHGKEHKVSTTGASQGPPRKTRSKRVST